MGSLRCLSPSAVETASGRGVGAVAAPRARPMGRAHQGRVAATVPLAGGMIRRGETPCDARPLLVPPPADTRREGRLPNEYIWKAGIPPRPPPIERSNQPTAGGSEGVLGVRSPKTASPPAVACPGSLARCPRQRPRRSPAHRGVSERLPPVTSCACSAFAVAQSQGRPSPTSGGVTGRAGSTVWRR